MISPPPVLSRFSQLQEQFKKHAGADQALDQKELAEIWIKAMGKNDETCLSIPNLESLTESNIVQLMIFSSLLWADV